MTRDIGKIGEKTLEALCAEAGIIATRPESDERGWDYLLELPAPPRPGFPIDRRKNFLSCKVQVKSTNLSTGFLVTHIATAFNAWAPLEMQRFRITGTWFDIVAQPFAHEFSTRQSESGLVHDGEGSLTFRLIFSPDQMYPIRELQKILQAMELLNSNNTLFVTLWFDETGKNAIRGIISDVGKFPDFGREVELACALVRALSPGSLDYAIATFSLRSLIGQGRKIELMRTTQENSFARNRVRLKLDAPPSPEELRSRMANASCGCILVDAIETPHHYIYFLSVLTLRNLAVDWSTGEINSNVKRSDLYFAAFAPRSFVPQQKLACRAMEIIRKRKFTMYWFSVTDTLPDDFREAIYGALAAENDHIGKRSHRKKWVARNR